MMLRAFQLLKMMGRGVVSRKKKSPVLIPGVNAVMETLIQGRSGVREVWVAEGKKGPRIEEVLQSAKKLGIPVHFKRRDEVDQFAPDIAHQGVLALADPFAYADLDAVVRDSLQGPAGALILAADHITDEGNLGALIRSAAFFGAHGLILPKDRSARITPKVLKRSAGAYVHLPIVQVVNLSRTLDLLSKKGFWVVGAAGEGSESIDRFDWKRDLVLVLGSEEKGLGHAVKKQCHQIVRIEGSGAVASLNVSVAGGVVFSEIVRQRRAGG